MGDYLKEILKDQDKRVKIYFAINIGIILTNLLIVIGAITFILIVIGMI